LSYAVQKRDCGLLKHINKVLKIKNPVRRIENNYCRVDVTQQGFIKAFAKWGITEKKSLTIEFPTNLPKKMISHFIRGVFDGDGTVTFKYRRNRHSFIQSARIVTCSKKFAEGLNEALTKVNIANTIRVELRENTNRSTLYSVCILASGYEAFYNYIYKNSSIHLARKKQVFKQLVKHRKTYLTEYFGGFRKDKIRKTLTKAYLTKQYKTKSAGQIAKVVGVNKTTICKYLKKFKIKAKARW
jgi:intein/homing endonuclease